MFDIMVEQYNSSTGQCKHCTDSHFYNWKVKRSLKELCVAIKDYVKFKFARD
jgi:hypothetical protein